MISYKVPTWEYIKSSLWAWYDALLLNLGSYHGYIFNNPRHKGLYEPLTQEFIKGIGSKETSSCSTIMNIIINVSGVILIEVGDNLSSNLLPNMEYWVIDKILC